MAQREGSIYLYLFIVACVLFIGMTVLYFVNSGEKERLTGALDAAQKKYKTAEDTVKSRDMQLATLRELIAGSRSEEWQGDINQLREYYFNDELKGKAEKAINACMAELKQTPRTYKSMAEPYADLPFLFQKLRESRDNEAAARAAADATKLKNEQDNQGVIAKLKEEKDALQQRIQELELKYEDLDGKAKARETELQGQVDKERDLRVESEVKLKRTINFKDNEIKSLLSRLERLQTQVFQEQSIETLEPDAKILYVLNAAGKAWIDLGRADHLTKGLRFRVFQTVKGGKRIVKGSVEVTAIDDKMSEMRIVEELDPLNPIVAGDFVTSPFYDRKATPVFVFAGTEFDSKNVTKEFIVSKMESYGARIRDKVDINTDFLVAMKNFENTPEYKTARELGVRIIRERDLLDFIGQ